MKDMTTAEFAKANLAALEEPVSVRRYTKVIGTYFPANATPLEGPVSESEQLTVTFASKGEAQKQIDALIEEVRQLKKRLAAKDPVNKPLSAELLQASADSMFAAGGKPSRNPFEGLAKQDREFFERKLGSKKKS